MEKSCLQFTGWSHLKIKKEFKTVQISRKQVTELNNFTVLDLKATYFSLKLKNQTTSFWKAESYEKKNETDLINSGQRLQRKMFLILKL